MKRYISNRVRSSADESLDLVKAELTGDSEEVLPEFIKPFSNGEVYCNYNYPTVFYGSNGVFVATDPMYKESEMWDEYDTPSEEVPGYIWKNPITGIKGQELAVKLSKQINREGLDAEDVHSKETFKEMDKLLSSMGFTLAGTHNEFLYE